MLSGITYFVVACLRLQESKVRRLLMRCYCPLFLIMCILFFLDLVFAMSALFESLEQATFVDRVDHNNNYICTNWLYFFVYAVVSFSPLLLKLVLFSFAFGFDIILLFNKRETKKNKI